MLHSLTFLIDQICFKRFRSKLPHGWEGSQITEYWLSFPARLVECTKASGKEKKNVIELNCPVTWVFHPERSDLTWPSNASESNFSLSQTLDKQQLHLPSKNRGVCTSGRWLPSSWAVPKSILTPWTTQQLCTKPANHPLHMHFPQSSEAATFSLQAARGGVTKRRQFLKNESSLWRQAPTLCSLRALGFVHLEPNPVNSLQSSSQRQPSAPRTALPLLPCYLFWFFLPLPGEPRAALQMDSYDLLALSFLGIYGFLSLFVHTLGIKCSKLHPWQTGVKNSTGL